MSNNFNNPQKYSTYNNGPMSLDDVMSAYKKHGIIPNRVELYHDFTSSLCDLIFTTYMGDDVTPIGERETHFDWCWDKNINNFFRLGFDLNDGGEKYKYFKSFFLDIFYLVDYKTKKLEDDVLIVWEYIFNYYIIKPEKDLYNFIDIYKMFDNTNWFKK